MKRFIENVFETYPLVPLCYQGRDARGRRVLSIQDEASLWGRRGFYNASWVVQSLPMSYWYQTNDCSIFLERGRTGVAEVFGFANGNPRIRKLTLNEKSLRVLRSKWSDDVFGWKWIESPRGVTLYRRARIRFASDLLTHLRASSYSSGVVNAWLDGKG